MPVKKLLGKTAKEENTHNVEMLLCLTTIGCHFLPARLRSTERSERDLSYYSDVMEIDGDSLLLCVFICGRCQLLS